MLTIVEELLLLALDDRSGEFITVPEHALSGAVLMELALAGKIDTDLRNLMVTDPTPIGDDLPDAALRTVVDAGATRDSTYWVNAIGENARAIQERAVDHLVEKEILRREAGRFLWVFETRRYPVIDNKEQKEVRLRILDVIFSDTIPDPRDIALISLLDASGLFRRMLDEDRLAQAAPRIAQVAKMDLVGHRQVGGPRRSGGEGERS